jgi:hypothetical protein
MAVGRIGRLTSARMISLMYEGMGEGVRRGSVSANGRTRSHISKCVVTSDDGWPKRASSKRRCDDVTFALPKMRGRLTRWWSERSGPLRPLSCGCPLISRLEVWCGSKGNEKMLRIARSVGRDTAPLRE